MNIAETAGGSSCKGQENGDASNESERPLKKARFAWQVKGKYHLKNETNDAPKPSAAISAEPHVAESSGSGCSSNNRGTEQKLDILGDYLMKQDFNTIDSVISAPEQSLLTPSTSLSSEKLPYPRYISSFEQSGGSNNILRKTSNSINDFKSIPTSMMVTQRFSEEQCIARWQNKQMVKGFVDNTINRVLDLWIQAPVLHEHDHPRTVALDVADFINNLPGDNSVENEGILMAISAHGLQQPASSSSSSDNSQTSTSSDNDEFHPLTPLPSDDESQEPVNTQSETDSSNDIDIAWSYSDDHKDDNDVAQFPLFPGTSSLSYRSVNDSHQNSSADSDGIDNPADSHCDFLDEAILFAIQSKGLTTFGSDYG